MSITILILLGVLLVIRQYALPFDQMGTLPYHYAFSLFSILVMFLGLINGIYLFGVWPGIAFFCLIFFNILQLCFLWPFTLLLYAAFHKNVQMGIYALFPVGTWILLFLTAINFFVSPYKALIAWVTMDLLKYLIIIGCVSVVVGQLFLKLLINIFTTKYNRESN